MDLPHTSTPGSVTMAFMLGSVIVTELPTVGTANKAVRSVKVNVDGLYPMMSELEMTGLLMVNKYPI